MSAPEHHADLPRDATAPGLARRAVERWFGPLLDAEELASVKLMTSELVTNAVVHGIGGITLRARFEDERVLIEVVDEGQGFERSMRKDDFQEVGGHGLAIVDAEASRWGIHEGTTHVWFEFERSGPRLGEEHNPLSDPPNPQE
ncbi:MAG TPA: ATP-binding protein [Solirubrobacteraceae bacterium]|nr:ATP-binding protein [Solirubrobacteraceae bacterium]